MIYSIQKMKKKKIDKLAKLSQKFGASQFIIIFNIFLPEFHNVGVINVSQMFDVSVNLAANFFYGNLLTAILSKENGPLGPRP